MGPARRGLGLRAEPAPRAARGGPATSAAGLARRALPATATAWRAASSPPSRRASSTARPRATRRSCSRSDMRRPCGAFTVAAMACWWEKYTRSTPSRGKTPPKENAGRRRDGRRRGARQRRAGHARGARGPRCGPSRAPRTRASGAGSAASAGMAPASCPFVSRRRSWPIQRPSLWA